MSAWIVTTQHIDLMVSAALQQHDFSWWCWSEQRRHDVNLSTATDVGRLLLAENIRSVSHRYRDEPLADLPGPITKTRPEDYVWTDHKIKLSPAEISSLLGCYDYQSCETSDWHTTAAYDFVAALRESVLDSIVGRDDVPPPWGRDAADIAARMLG